MGRTNHYLRQPLTRAPEPEPALLAAVQGALAALAADHKETTPSAIEGWIKANRYEVWASITTASALRHAIEAAKREQPEPRPDIAAKGVNGVSKKKKTERRQPPKPPTRPATKPAPAKTTATKAVPAVEAEIATKPAVVKNEEPLAEVVRKALDGVGAKAQPKAIKRWITRHYPGRQFNASALSRAINTQRPRPRQDGGEARTVAPVKPRPAARSATPAAKGASAPAPVKVRPAAAPDYDPTRTELLRVLGIARDQGGVSRLGKMVQAVKQLADQVGGVDRLAACLEALEELGVK
jgi:hypothetical protein